MSTDVAAGFPLHGAGDVITPDRLAVIERQAGERFAAGVLQLDAYLAGGAGGVIDL